MPHTTGMNQAEERTIGKAHRYSDGVEIATSRTDTLLRYWEHFHQVMQGPRAAHARNLYMVTMDVAPYEVLASGVALVTGRPIATRRMSGG